MGHRQLRAGELFESVWLHGAGASGETGRAGGGADAAARDGLASSSLERQRGYALSLYR